MSGWQEVRRAAKDDWRSNTMKFGEQFVMTTSTILMLVLSVTVLDSGWYHFFGKKTYTPMH